MQIRADDTETKEIVFRIDDKDVRITTTAERIVFSALQCGCHAPAGAFATITADKISISAFLSDSEGQNFRRCSLSGPVTAADRLARRLATDILDSANPKDV
jgi:hydroxymethylbilane synthase